MNSTNRLSALIALIFAAAGCGPLDMEEIGLEFAMDGVKVVKPATCQQLDIIPLGKTGEIGHNLRAPKNLNRSLSETMRYGVTPGGLRLIDRFSIRCLRYVDNRDYFTTLEKPMGGFQDGGTYMVGFRSDWQMSQSPMDTQPFDSDNDGVNDVADVCPLERGIAELHGCPDRDGDHYADYTDVCPDRPSGNNPDLSRPGCPTPVEPVVGSTCIGLGRADTDFPQYLCQLTGPNLVSKSNFATSAGTWVLNTDTASRSVVVCYDSQVGTSDLSVTFFDNVPTAKGQIAMNGQSCSVLPPTATIVNSSAVQSNGIRGFELATIGSAGYTFASCPRATLPSLNGPGSCQAR